MMHLKRRPTPQVATTQLGQAWTWLALVLVLCAAAFVRYRLLELPLERDEGEYAYAGQLLLEGIAPYKLVYSMKLPGTDAAYAVIMAIFGETTRGIHLGLIVVNTATSLLLFFLGRRLFGTVCGLVAASCFALLSLSSSVLGLAAHATHFVTLFAVAGTLLLLKTTETGKWNIAFRCGIAFGLAFLMKQAGIFFGLFAGCYLLWSEVNRPVNWRNSGSRLSLFCAGAILPFALTCIILFTAGVFDHFWAWTFSYAREYGGMQSLQQGWTMFYSTGLGIFNAAPVIWLIAVLGIPLTFLHRDKRNSAFFTLAFLATSFLVVCPGWYFREHYFIPLLPAAGLFAGAAIQTVCDRTTRRRSIEALIAGAVLLVAVGQIVFYHWRLFFQLTPREAAREIYSYNPFPESIAIARYIREHSKPDSRVAVIGSEPQIYFYSHRHSATGYIYTYMLMEPQEYAARMQREMMAEVEAASPDFVVLVHVTSSWLKKKDSPRTILEWADNYTRKMRLVGLIDIRSLQETVYYWDEEAVTARPRSDSFVAVFRRSELF